MEKGISFEILPEQISEIGVQIRQHSPEYVWGDDELRNAIFETLVIRYNLPWDEDIGAPDWKDPRVIMLSKVFKESLERDNNIEIIDGIESRCTVEDCGWHITSQAKVEKTDRILDECELTSKCREHHLGTGQMTKHNRFDLYKEDRRVGFASVSSQVCTGYVEPLK